MEIMLNKPFKTNDHATGTQLLARRTSLEDGDVRCGWASGLREQESFPHPATPPWRAGTYKSGWDMMQQFTKSTGALAGEV